MVEVEDDGVGMGPERNDASPVSGLVKPGTGIGVRNVRERMEVLYGDLATVEMNSRPGRGTKVTLLMPILDAGAEAWGPIWGATGRAIGHLAAGAHRGFAGSSTRSRWFPLTP